MMANPPFGVEWKTQQKFIEKEHDEFGFDGGRFGPGLPPHQRRRAPLP
jgi:type I restriction enzyme M protein